MTLATDQPAGWNRPSRQNPPEPDEPGGAVAIVKRAEIMIGMPVNTLDEAFRLSNALSHSGLVPDALRGKGPDILAILLYGRELGLSAWQSINGIHVIEGRPSMSAELRVAKTIERGHLVGIACRLCGEFGNHPTHTTALGVGGFEVSDEMHRFDPDWDSTRCTVRAVRGDNGMLAVVTWTVEDAVAAGKLRRMPDGSLQARGKNGGVLPWEADTPAMLYARASNRAAKLIDPGVGYGVYTPDDDVVRVESTVDRLQCSFCREFGHVAEVCPRLIDDSADDGAIRAAVADLEKGDVDV